MNIFEILKTIEEAKDEIKTWYRLYGDELGLQSREIEKNWQDRCKVDPVLIKIGKTISEIKNDINSLSNIIIVHKDKQHE